MKKQILLGVFFGLINYGNAQVKNDVIKDNEVKKLKIVQAKYKDFETRLQREIYDEHFSEIERKLNKGYNENYISLDKDFNQLVKDLFQKFKQNNSSYQLNDANAYVINDNTPNAFTAGFDYFFINTGMFNLIDNEYQLAAVIGHELAHNYLKHSRESILQHAEFTKDFQKKMKSVKKSEMIKLIQSQDEVIQKKYDLANQSRKKEISADSLGFIFYNNLNYPKEEYLNLLSKLKKLDEDVYYTIKDETYQSVFNVNGVEVKPKWLKLEKDDLFAGLTFTEHVDKDSVRSHPNTTDRIEWSMNQFKLTADPEKPAEPSEFFKNIKEKAELNYYDNLLLHNSYDFALYHILNQLQKENPRKDLEKNLGIIFQKFYDSRIKHQFNKYVAIADANDKDVDYNRFLNLLWNIPTPDYKNLAEYYTKKAAQ